MLTLASYDDDIGKTDLQTQLEQCIKLISVFPMLAVYGYHAYNYYECGGSMYIHRPDPNLSTAENLLKCCAPDQKYTDLEAHVLDIALLLHMEHGGGNNSTFTTRVVTSSGSDTYSVIAAALSSLKGPKHGGANIKVMKMMDDIRAHVADPLDEAAMADYLGRIVDRQAFDQKGLIYCMGHAVYSLSDPALWCSRTLSTSWPMPRAAAATLSITTPSSGWPQGHCRKAPHLQGRFDECRLLLRLCL